MSAGPFDLEGRAAVVMGGAGGIGAAIALALAEAGADVAVVARLMAAAEEAAAAIEGAGRASLRLGADMANVEEVREAVRAVRSHFGRLDVLVNAAGTNLRRPALEVTEEEWDLVANVNLRGTFFSCQEAARLMAPQGHGKIVNITSLTAVIGLAQGATYGATRGGGVNQLTKALAVEWAPLGISVNAIAPGRVRTRMTEDIFADDAVRESFLRLIPLGRAGTPRDVAGAAVFLASDAADYIVGQTLVVDGGWLAAGGNPLR